MKIIITGCGKIGTTITSCLASEGHDLVCIDNDAEVVNEIVNIYDVMGVCGNGADSDTLTEAGVGRRAVYCSYRLGRAEYAELLYSSPNGRKAHNSPYKKSRI